jgi:hypothetical protein
MHQIYHPQIMPIIFEWGVASLFALNHAICKIITLEKSLNFNYTFEIDY